MRSRIFQGHNFLGMKFFRVKSFSDYKIFSRHEVFQFLKFFIISFSGNKRVQKASEIWQEPTCMLEPVHALNHFEVLWQLNVTFLGTRGYSEHASLWKLTLNVTDFLPFWDILRHFLSFWDILLAFLCHCFDILMSLFWHCDVIVLAREYQVMTLFLTTCILMSLFWHFETFFWHFYVMVLTSWCHCFDIVMSSCWQVNIRLWHFFDHLHFYVMVLTSWCHCFDIVMPLCWHTNITLWHIFWPLGGPRTI